MPAPLTDIVLIDNPSKDSYLIDFNTISSTNITIDIASTLFDGQTIKILVRQNSVGTGIIGFTANTVFATGYVPSLSIVPNSFMLLHGIIVQGLLHVGIVEIPDMSNLVLKAGDTMTGPLVLPSDPVAALQAATKQYVDASVPDLATRVTKTGDTMSGALTVYPYIVGQDNVSATVGTTGVLRLGALAQAGMSIKANDSSFAFIDFVDNLDQRTNVTYTFGTTLLEFGVYLNEVSGPAALSIDFSTGSTTTKQTTFTNNQEYVTKAYVDSVLPDLSTVVAKSGDTMTGLLILSGDPTVALGATTKQYVDTTAVSVAGDTMTGTLTLTGTAGITMSGDLTAASGSTSVVIHSNGSPLTLTNTGLTINTGAFATNSNITVSGANITINDGATDFIVLDGPTGNIATTKGTVTVSRDPATDFEVATKQYVDASIVAATTMTHYVHLQTTTSTSWTIPHNLGTTNLIMNTYINTTADPVTGLKPVTPLDVTFVDLNNVTITFSATQTGKVVIIAVP